MTVRGAAGRCPPMTWLVPWLLLLCLLASRGVTEVESKHCSQMIGDGHLQRLQHLIDSQMKTTCRIPFVFVDPDRLKDPVCYVKKAFLLVQDIMEDSISFKDNTSNANTLVDLQELSVRLKDCFPKVHEGQNKDCVRNFSESPLQLLERIKNVFIETKNLLKENQTIFSKNCSDSFAECSIQDVVTKPDCNCLHPKATPSSDLASVSPQQPLAPSMAPMAGLTWADSEGTKDSSLLPSEQPLHTVDPDSAKQRPPRSTCQSFESTETAGAEGGPAGGSPQPPRSFGAPASGMEAVLDSVLSPDWALEEASGEASEGPVPRGPEPPSPGLGGGGVQAENARRRDLISASPLPGSFTGQLVAHGTGTSLLQAGPVRPTGQARSPTPQKTDRPPAPRKDRLESGSARTLSLRQKGLGRLPAQTRLAHGRAWGSALPFAELQGRRSPRRRRSAAGLEGGRASEGAAVRHAHLNSVPLTGTGPQRWSSGPQPLGIVFRLLVPGGGVVLVLLAIGGLLLYRRRRRSPGEPRTAESPESPVEQREGSPLTQDENRRAETPV